MSHGPQQYSTTSAPPSATPACGRFVQTTCSSIPTPRYSCAKSPTRAFAPSRRYPRNKTLRRVCWCACTPCAPDAHYGPRHVTAAWASLQCCAGRAQAGLFRPGPDRYSTPARPRHALFAPCVIRFGAWPEVAVRARRDRQRERTRLQPARTPVLAPCCSAAPCSLGQPPPPCSLSRRAPVRRPARVTWPAGNCLLGGARRAALWPRRAAAQAVRGKLRPDHCLCRPHAAPGRSSGGAYP